MSDYECPYRKEKHSGFKVSKRNCGHGVHGKISVIKSKSDDSELIWKRPVNDSRIHQKSFKKEIEKSKYWRKIGVSRVKVCWHSDKKSLIKTLIKGQTLGQTLRDHPHFFSNTHNKAYKELGKFVRCLVKSRHYIQDCNRANLVYDKEYHKWNLIDSSNIQKKSSRHEIVSKFKKKFLTSWSHSLDSHDEKEALKSFLDKYCE